MPWEPLVAILPTVAMGSVLVIAFVRRRRIGSGLLDGPGAVRHDVHSLNQRQPQVSQGHPYQEPWPRRD